MNCVQKHFQIAVSALIKAQSEMDVACDGWDDEGGWLDCYSHEPFSGQVEWVVKIFAALRGLLHESAYHFEVRLFCPDGYATIRADGTVTEQTALNRVDATRPNP